MKRYVNEAALRAIGSRVPEGAKSMERPDTAILAVDPSDLERVLPPETDDERYQRCERIGTAMLAEAMRLEPYVRKGERAPEPIRINDAGEFEEFAWPMQRGGGQHVTRTTAGVMIVHRDTGLAVAQDTERSQFKNKELAMKRLRALLVKSKASHAAGEPLSCAGCGGAESTCNCDCGGNTCGCPCHRAQEAWALGKS